MQLESFDLPVWRLKQTWHAHANVAAMLPFSAQSVPQARWCHVSLRMPHGAQYDGPKHDRVVVTHAAQDPVSLYARVAGRA